MNILVLINKLDRSPFEREIRNGYTHGDVITFYNESNNEYNLKIDNIEYCNVIQVCIILKEDSYYIYVQYGENSNFVKIKIDDIEEIDYFT